MAYAKNKKKRASAVKPGSSEQMVEIPPRTESFGGIDDEHGKLLRWVNECDQGTVQDTHELSHRCRAYYDSDQWTDAERAKLKAQKQAATVINRIKPKMDGLMGMESANRTTAKAQPRTPKHTAGATAATEAVRYVLQDNFYNEKRSDSWENLVIEGTGGIEVIAEDMGEGEDIRLTINNIMWDRIIYDPHSRRKDFSDARYLGQVVWMDYDEAEALYPDAVDVLDTMQTTDQTYGDKPRWMDNTRKRVKIVELYYYRADGDVWYACFTYGGYLKAPTKSPYINEEGETEWPYEFASLFVTTEGVRYGAAFQYLDVQDEINKRRSKALHLMSVRQTFGTAGAVADVNKARAEMAKPDGHVEFAYGELNKDFGVLPTGDMAAAQFNLLTEAKMEIDAVGYNAAASGKDTRAISGVALRQRTQASQTELAPMFNVLKHLDIRVYRKVWNRVKQYWKAEKWVRVTDDENNLKFVGLNAPTTKGEQLLKQAQEKGLPPEALQQLQQKIAMDPAMAEKVTENDVNELDVDIIMDDAPDTVTQEVEDFQAMAEMVKSGFPIPPEAVIMASPLSNKDRILKMMKEKPQLPPQVQEQMKKMQEEMQKLAQENQALKADTQGEQAKLQFSAQEAQAKLQQRQAEAQAELQLKAQTQAAELQLERERAEATIQLERMKAVASLELEQMKIAAQSDGDVDTAINAIKNLATQHEIKVKGMIQAKEAADKAAEEGAEATDPAAGAEAMSGELSNLVSAMTEALTRKKTITAKSSSGATMTATVQ